jgi:hypothetical protein
MPPSADVYPEVESGLAKIPLDWMIREATVHGLRINSVMRNHLVLGRPRAGAKTAFVKPDARAAAHNSLTWGWRPLEWIPKSRRWREWPRREIAGFYIPRAEPRLIQSENGRPLIHQSVVDRMERTSYNPINLPNEYIIEH